MEYTCKNIKIEILDGGSILIKGSIAIAIDPAPDDSPYLLSQRISLVLVSHDHKNRLSSESLLQLNEITERILVGGTKRMDEVWPPEKVMYVKPGVVMITPDVRIQVLPAHNVDKYKAPGILYHPMATNGVGYVVLVDGTKLYYTGHTDKLPEMARIEDLDVLISPVSESAYLAPNEVAGVVSALDPTLIVPIYPKNKKLATRLRRELVATCDKMKAIKK